MVYRGCADQENLNFGVDTHRQCAYQGGSLYYFCKGDLCNFGQIGHVCGHKPAPHKHYNHKSKYRLHYLPEILAWWTKSYSNQSYPNGLHGLKRKDNFKELF